MDLCKSKMDLCIAVYVLVMLLFAEAQYDVIREIIVANAGENITLICNTRYTSNIHWVKNNQYFIATVNEDHPKGVLYDNPILTQSYAMEISSGLFELYIFDARVESAIYACRHSITHIQEYDVRVIGCPACFVNLSSSHDLEQARMDVNCLLNNFHTTERIQLHITMNRNKTNTGIIKGSILTFNTSITMMYDTIRVEFNPFTDTRSNIICIVPAQLTTAQSHTSVKLSPSTSLITTLATSSAAASAKSSATKSDTRPETTSAAITTAQLTTPQSYTSVTLSPSTSLITMSATSSSKTSTTKSETTGTTTTGTKPYDSTSKSSSSPIMDTSYLTSGTTTSNQMRKNINTETGNITKTNGLTIIITAILGAILMIVVIVIIFVLRLKRSRDRQHGKHNEGEINVAVRKQDTCYESIGGSSGIRDGELINNVLYQSSDDIIQTSILRSGDDQLDTALYTIPDKTGIINRVAKSEVVSVSSCGNSSVHHHQHEQKEFKQVGAGDDDDTNIPLYAMPDKGPRSTRNTMKASPGSASVEDGADIPLYAMPDKRPGTKGNIIKATPGPGTRNEGDEIPLYAVLNKGPGSKENQSTVKPKPGDQSKASNNDATLKEALYAEVDKSN